MNIEHLSTNRVMLTVGVQLSGKTAISTPCRIRRRIILEFRVDKNIIGEINGVIFALDSGKVSTYCNRQ